MWSGLGEGGGGEDLQGLAIGRYASARGRPRPPCAPLGLQDKAQVVLGRGPVLRQRGAGAHFQGLAIGRYGLSQEGRARLPAVRVLWACKTLPRLVWIVAQCCGSVARVKTSRAWR